MTARGAGALALLALLVFAAPRIAASRISADSSDLQEEVGDQDQEVDRMIRAARTGRQAVRPQAAQRLVAMGAPAAERLVAECGDGPDRMAGLGRDLIEVLGAFEDPRLRAKLWEAIDALDFPWRPAAARSLALAPHTDEIGRFSALLGDRLSPVRDAAITAFANLDLRDRASAIRALLDDENDRVRRSAAILLDRWGEPGVLLWLVEDLKRSDRYFGQRTGKAARYAAKGLLEERLGDLHGYDAERGPVENSAALEKITAAALAGAPRPELPAIALASEEIEGDVLGLELRSCRRGEYFLRWNAADVLYVGQGHPVAVELPAGTVARLVEAAGPLLEALGKQRLWGEPGCDVEQVHFWPAGVKRSRTYQVAKGYQQVDGLRPKELADLVRLLVATVPESGPDPRVTDLRARVVEALAVLGGPLSD